MKKLLAVVFVMSLIGVGISYAQSSAPSSADLNITLDMTLSSKYIWRGFQVYGDKTAMHPSLDLFNPTSGFGFNATGHRANSSGYEINERWDYTLYYLGKAFQEEQFEMMYRLAYVYYNYPELSSHSKESIDLHELHAVLSFPKLLGVEGLVPSYVLVKLAPVNSGTVVGANSPSGGTASGFAHIFMLDYAMPYVCPLTGVDRKLNWHAEAVFNDGVAPDGGNTLVKGQFRGPADHDWSNGVIGATTSYELAENVNLTPGLFFQSSWDDSVCSDDQLWGTLSLTAKF